MTATNSDVWALSVEGVPHDPALARVGNFLASGPKRGIVPAGPQASGAVRPTSVPSNRGLVLPFVGVAPNPAPGHFGETYVFRSRTAKEFTLRPASSGGSRTDAIITRIWDTGVFGGTMPGDDYVTVEVIEGVDPGLESADVLAAEHVLDFPFIWHGNVTLPASQNEVNLSRITDRRFQIGGQTWHGEHIRVGDIGTRLLMSRDTTNGEIFPHRGAQHHLFIPESAGEMKITFEWLDVEYLGEANTYGNRWVRVGSGNEYIETHHYHFDGPEESRRETTNWKVVDVLPIPVEMRGTTQLFTARAALGSNAAQAQVRVRERGATILDVEFRETLN